jgi:hypothetical protein
VNTLWSYFWPVFAVGLLAGLLAGIFGFRGNRKRIVVLGPGLLIAFALAGLWHGPLGGADRLSGNIERDIHTTLVYYEMTQVTGHLHHDPLTRRVELSGPADDFQRSELARLMDEIPGVSGATWSSGRGIPLIAEGLAVTLLGFLLGLLLAYLVELRRRHNAQWNW